MTSAAAPALSGSHTLSAQPEGESNASRHERDSRGKLNELNIKLLSLAD